MLTLSPRACLLQTPVHREDPSLCPGQPCDRVPRLALRCRAWSDSQDLGAVPRGQCGKARPKIGGLWGQRRVPSYHLPCCGDRPRSSAFDIPKPLGQARRLEKAFVLSPANRGKSLCERGILVPQKPCLIVHCLPLYQISH